MSHIRNGPVPIPYMRHYAKMFCLVVSCVIVFSHLPDQSRVQIIPALSVSRLALISSPRCGWASDRQGGPAWVCIIVFQVTPWDPVMLQRSLCQKQRWDGGGWRWATGEHFSSSAPVFGGSAIPFTASLLRPRLVMPRRPFLFSSPSESFCLSPCFRDSSTLQLRL